jgi:hypothetical protein
MDRLAVDDGENDEILFGVQAGFEEELGQRGDVHVADGNTNVS